ncbi:MAG TPA: hypothetical protein VGB64_03555 [Actinomycetota bacterium]
MTEPPNTPGGGAPGGPDWGEMKGQVMAAKGPDRLILIAGALFFVDSFLPWYGFSFGGFGANIKGWSAGGLAVLSILFAIAALALAVLRIAKVNVQLGASDGLLYLILGGGAFVFALLRFITETRLTKFGLYIAIVLGAILAYAGWMKKKAEA